MPILSRETDHPVTIVVDGRTVTGRAPPRMLLSDFLRETLGATGTHVGCEHGVCGACTVRVDGLPVRSCLLFAVQADGCRIDTVEGLANADGSLSVLQNAFRRHHALQCGFCTPGILMTLDALLQGNPAPTEREVREALSGHLCRCTGYAGIVRATLDAAQRRGEIAKEEVQGV